MQKDINFGWRFSIVFLALCMIVLLSTLDVTIVAGAFPTITRVLNLIQYAWVMNAYTLS
jgi:MFS family permease